MPLGVPLPAHEGSSMNTLCSHCSLFSHTFNPSELRVSFGKKDEEDFVKSLHHMENVSHETADLNRDLYLYIAHKWH